MSLLTPDPSPWRQPTVIAAVLVAAAITFAFLDRPMVLTVASWPEAVIGFFERITDVGHATKFLVVGAVGYVVFRWIVRWPRAAAASALLFGSITLAGVPINLLKIVVGRFRPYRFVEAQQWGFDPMTVDYAASSFPSGHTSTICAVAFSLALVFPRQRLAWFSIAALIGFSRVAVLAHYPSDVIIGGYIGTLVAATWSSWYLRLGGDWRAAART